MKSLVSLAVAAASLAVVGTIAMPAHAVLVAAAPDCANGDALAAMSPAAVACLGSFAGNDANQQVDVLAMITVGFIPTVGFGVWSLVEKVDTGDTGAFLASVPAATTGTITFVDPVAGNFGLVLKAANQFSIYLFDGGLNGISALDFSTIGTATNSRGKAQDLSHASLYSFAPSSGVTPIAANPSAVPVPASGVLFGLGLLVAGIGAKFRARRQGIADPS